MCGESNRNLGGKAGEKLEVLKDCNPAAVEEGKRFIGEKRIDISLKKNITEKLYIEVCCKSGGNKATAIIAGGHTTFIYIARNGDVLLNKQSAGCGEEEAQVAGLTLRKVYDFAMNAPLDEIRFILETARLNKAAAERSFDGYVAIMNTRFWVTAYSPISFLTRPVHAMPVWQVL